MFIRVEDHKFSEEQVKHGEYQQVSLSEENIYALEFVRSWLNSEQKFLFQSSGSTGKPKKIVLSREVLAYSAKKTLEKLDLLNREYSKFLLCISPKFIGGKMILARALVSGADVDIISPNTDFEKISDHYQLVSMVPIQVEKVLVRQPHLFENFGNVLIGGAALPKSVEEQLVGLKTNFYHTYGMTETASHVALRRIPSKHFEGIGDVEFKVENNRLIIRGRVTENKWISTNDIVQLRDQRSFVWLQRSDFIINSGGFKIDPERVEDLLRPQFNDIVAVSSVPDKRLGKKAILVTEGSKKDIDLSHLHPYERPKIIIWSKKIPLTESGKIDRLALEKLALNEVT